jgi:4-hydroxybenzoate polyprenyltransferase
MWLRLGRVSNLPTVWTNVLAGVALAGGTPSTSAVLGLIGALSLFYTAGMYLNDAFDRNVDARERPERPIPSGQVRASTVFAIGFCLLGAGWLAILGVARSEVGAEFHWAGWGGAALAACIVAYDRHHKNNPLSPLLMGLCRVLVYVVVGLATTADLEPALLIGALALLCHLIGLTYAAKQETLARLASTWPLAFLAAAPVYGMYLAWNAPLVAGFVVLHVAFSAYAVSFLLSARRRSIPGAVVRLIAAVALLDAVLIASSGAWAIALVAVGLCALTRVLQRVIPGT